ncbi:UNVERIFIED_CONTAM: hypothetical protein HDU68_009365 [Siphonaria sp. JEL0065]|nr:hypothetical protein HDU68_009365 [Siphonaria sp. JEL0065]
MCASPRAVQLELFPSSVSKDLALVTKNLEEATLSNKPSLDTLPRELLDQIVSHLDSKSIFPLCHAIPSLKHISETIYKVGAAFKMPVSALWSEIYLPAAFSKLSSVMNKRLPQHPCIISSKSELDTVGELVKLVTRYGGVVKVQVYSLEYLKSIEPILPRQIDLYVALGNASDWYYFYEGLDPFESILESLPDSRKVRMLDIPYIDADDDDHEGPAYLDMPQVFKVAVTAQILRCFSCLDFPFHRLSEFPNLRQLEFDSFRIEEMDMDVCLNELQKNKGLCKISFENIRQNRDSDCLDTVREVRGLNKAGWTWRESVGEIYGNFCVVWERVGSVAGTHQVC